MDRRGFLGAILATGIAPAVCKADWLMRGSGLLVASQEIVLRPGGINYVIGDVFRFPDGTFDWPRRNTLNGAAIEIQRDGIVLEAGELVVGKPCLLVFDGTAFQLQEMS